jgi:hypothetical protein
VKRQKRKAKSWQEGAEMMLRAAICKLIKEWTSMVLGHQNMKCVAVNQIYTK